MNTVAGGMPIIVFILYFVFLLVTACVGLVQYILQSLALQKIASRRNINHAWLAWIPYGVVWIIGSIADEYDSKNGIKRKWRVLLLVLPIIGGVMIAGAYLFVLVFVLSLGLNSYVDFSDTTIMSMIIPICIMYLALFAGIFVVYACVICEWICIFKIFESTVPEKAVKYLLISWLVPLGMPITLFLCRNKGYEYTLPVEETEHYIDA